MTVIENINIAYVSQDLSLLSSADADGTKDLRYLSVFAIGCTPDLTPDCDILALRVVTEYFTPLSSNLL